MSDPVRPLLRRQPTRLRHPWDSSGKNTGVGCHFLLQMNLLVKIKCISNSLVLQLSLKNPLIFLNTWSSICIQVNKITINRVSQVRNLGVIFGLSLFIPLSWTTSPSICGFHLFDHFLINPLSLASPHHLPNLV